ncbi:ech hydrogenase subunit E [Candidatus Omnitrophus magneticus]|uniref:Ech hydrogenase subunit E n=1 Tax=Candidatus Omnitrophus magneticus TaxID=1609969 RepID=A0A0F0CWZ2_9BACT|nr:ech hydrogenase subunit E [Candidatus Omnitrophus magneticus]
MGKRTIIPFGPQHPVLPEPIHLDLVLEDEVVVDAIPSIGFIHRGLEKLVEKKDFVDYVFVADRICGICSFIHGLTYCMAIEELMRIEVPSRAKYLRTIWSEFSRIQSHLLWLGLMADAFGFESLFMRTWRLREQILDIIEATTGSRVIFSASKIGGTRRDIDNETLKAILQKIQTFKIDIKEATDVFLKDATVKHRLCGVGILNKNDAYELGAVGPMVRASGIISDTRKLGYAAYKEIDFEPIIDTAGDSFARCAVRIKEIFQSIDIISQAISRIPEGVIETKITGTPNGEFFARTEQPRGEVIYYAKADGSRFLNRLRVRTPTFANIPAILKVIPGSSLADIPVLILTIDPCISCTER